MGTGMTNEIGSARMGCLGFMGVVATIAAAVITVLAVIF